MCEGDDQHSPRRTAFTKLKTMINTGYPENAALITREGQITYSELFRNIQQYADSFSHKKTELVAIFAPNSVEWVYSFFAAWANGSAVVPIDAGSSKEDVAYILDDCKPGLLFAAPGQRALLEESLALSTERPEIRYFGELELPPVRTPDLPVLDADPMKMAVIIYTSGTTGSPKGVMLSFANLNANVKGVTEDIRIYREERQVLVLLPLHHIFPLAGSMLAPLKVGAAMVMAPSMQSDELLATLKQNQVAIMIGVPRLYELLYKSIRAKIQAKWIARLFYSIVSTLKTRKLAKKLFHQVHETLGGHLEILVAGGAALNPEVGKFFHVLGFEVLEGYGMTEAAPMITFTRPGHVVIGSAGQALPGLQIETRNGEIVAKGPNIMMGYFNRPDETAEVLKEGWLHTGDLGEIDAKGYLRITGRRKEILVLPSGKNINPVELELKLATYAAFIKESAVLLHQEVLHALIVLDPAKMPAEAAIDPERYFRESVFPAYNQSVASYKRITQFTLTETELPRTKLSKVQRFKLEESLGSRRKVQQQQSGPLPEAWREISRFLEELTGKVVSPSDHLEYDLALDSLGKISLIDWITKNYGVEIAEDAFKNYPTAEKLAAWVSENKQWSKHQEISWSDIIREKVHLKLPTTWPTIHLIKNTALSFFTLYFRFSAHGVKNLPEGPCIIAPNHQSFFDGLFVASMLKWKIMRKTYFFAKQKHVNTGFLRFLANSNNVIVVDTNKDLKESIQKMAEVLKKGRKIIVFPEGTRTKDGALGEFKRTFAILSKELEVPVVPVVIDGAYRALPRGAVFPRPFARVRVSFQPPVYPHDDSYDTISGKIRQIISNKLK